MTTRRIPRAVFAYFGTKGLRLLLNTATAILVLMLPYSAAMSARAEASPTDVATPSLAAVPSDDLARAQTAARGVIAGTRSPTTVAAEESRPIVIRTIAKDDTLSTMANYYAISLESLAYANGIADEGQTLAIGHELVIPPGEGAVYTVKDGGLLACLGARDGKVIRNDRLPGRGSYYSSPVAGDGKIYLLDVQGRLSVVRAGRDWEVLGSSDFEEDTYATPAIAGGRIYLRTAGHLYCFGLPGKK